MNIMRSGISCQIQTSNTKFRSKNTGTVVTGQYDYIFMLFIMRRPEIEDAGQDANDKQ
jgi:hypothetical protein